MAKLSKRGAMLRDLVQPINFNDREIMETGEWSHVSIDCDSETGPHHIDASAYGTGTVRLSFTVDPDTARKLILAYDQRDEPAPIGAVMLALDAAIKATDARIAELADDNDNEEAEVVGAECAEHAETLRNIRDIAAGAPVDEDMPRIFFTPSEAVALAKGVRFDAVSAAAGHWPWYVLDGPHDDGEHDSRAVEREGEWRIYFETAVEAINTLDL